MLRLELLDEKLTAGKALSAHDGRTFSALSNQVRLIARELGVKAAAAEKTPDLAGELRVGERQILGDSCCINNGVSSRGPSPRQRSFGEPSRACYL